MRADRLPVVLARWSGGLGLVSWRYLWSTVPMHRHETRGMSSCCRAPRLPAHLVDRVLTEDDGAGARFHRRFLVQVSDPQLSAVELMERLRQDFGRFTPREVVGVRAGPERATDLGEDDEFVVEMPGPWNGPVVVAHVDEVTLRLATLPGHLEAGQVQLRAEEVADPDSGQPLLRFQVDTWARAATRVVDLLYGRLRLAKEIQLNMWVRVCRSAAAHAGGRAVGGIRIDTHRASDAGELLSGPVHRRPRSGSVV